MVNFENGKSPYLSKQNLMKMQQDANDYADEKHKINESTMLFDEGNIIKVTPTTGQNVTNWGGSYYYKVGTKVHVHLGINLNTNVRSEIFNLPEGFRPKGTICTFGGGADGNVPDTSLIEVIETGKIYAKSNTKFVCADIEYDAFN